MLNPAFIDNVHVSIDRSSAEDEAMVNELIATHPAIDLTIDLINNSLNAEGYEINAEQELETPANLEAQINAAVNDLIVTGG